MQRITLFRYIRQDGGITVSTEKPDAEYSQLYRLVADPGCALTDGNIITACIDTDKSEEWMEIANTKTVSEEHEAVSPEFGAEV